MEDIRIYYIFEAFFMLFLVNFEDDKSELGPELSSVAWSTGAQLIVFFCFRFSLVLFDRPGISIRLAAHCVCRVLVFASS